MNLEEAIDELYGAGFDAFVAERRRLVEEARGAGDRDEARAIAGLRKPTVAAGHRLRDAQAGLLAGE